MDSKIMFPSTLTVPIKQYCCNNTLTTTTTTTSSSSSRGNGRMYSSSSSSVNGNQKKKRFLQLLPTQVASPSISMFDFVNIDVEEEEERDVTVRRSKDKLSEVWREIQGINGWDDLLDPLDPLLLTEIVRYGELVNVCYKAFDLDPKSKRYLNCKYGKRTILRDVGLTTRGTNDYDVTKYIYATSPNNNCRWIGYVAVSSDSAVRRLGRRDILVSFRGTVTNAEWYANLMSSLTPARLDPHDPRPNVMVESGFLSIYTSADTQTSRFGHRSCREQLLREIARLIDLYKEDGEEISITLAGHSMGSSLAILLGYDLAELGLNIVNGCETGRKEIPITVYSFAGPRVGNLEFKNRCDELGVKVLRVVNVNDPITKLPGVFLNDEEFKVFGFEFELPWRSSSNYYTHVGVELSLHFFKVRDPSCVHDLQHLINGLMMKNMIINGEEGGGEDWKQWIGHQVLFKACELSCLWQDAAVDVCNMVQSLGF